VNRPDLIAVIEQAYTLGGTDRDWLQALVDRTRPLLDRGLGVYAELYEALPGRPVDPRVLVAAGTIPALDAKVPPLIVAAPPEIIERTFRAFSGCATVSELTLGAALDENPIWRELVQPHGMHDALCVNIIGDPRVRGCSIQVPMPRIGRASATLRHTWGRMAAHLGAGLRLRQTLGGASPLDGAEAILAPSGRLEHAEEAAQSTEARERLRAAAVRIDRARGRLRRNDPSEALTLWDGLVAGRWSLVDHFERSGRRYLVARRNDPGVEDPRTLNLRERQIVWYASLGHSNKLIGYELGLSSSTVATHLTRASEKLSVGSRMELIALVRAVLGGGGATPKT
jgi:DNA-binding CsgD family transcriptional regulator